MTRAAASGVGKHVLGDLRGHKTTDMADRYFRAMGDLLREAREQVGASPDVDSHSSRGPSINAPS